MSKHLIAALIGLLPVAGSAQTFSVPDGCEGVVTVQQKGCLLVNIWQCSADPEGDKWIGLFSEAGLYSVQHVDREFQWLEAFKMSGSEALVQPADDPASMTELLENGLDTYEFVIDKESGAERTVGFDTLTGVETVIDGEPLLQTEFEGQTLAEDGSVIDMSGGRQWVSAKHRLFFFGESWDAGNPEASVDLSPVEFIYPDEAGFFSENPKFECGVIESRFTK
ncbi:MAG: hypothetical protein MUR46_04940 [Loktanella sp.]|jgi:hypothetical protein|nr:hypothetical protein [Loktanella sp.]MDO7609125.1 hypothetical protein [Loktanella sp.]MDO7623822.1 hypothetical protein [Loktanella sp.]MDO7625023.1 hypothetical protein [Loktanella sp.]MDO7631833.1 hypothetical protein [Loktanella sp.]